MNHKGLMLIMQEICNSDAVMRSEDHPEKSTHDLTIFGHSKTMKRFYKLKSDSSKMILLFLNFVPFLVTQTCNRVLKKHNLS